MELVALPIPRLSPTATSCGGAGAKSLEDTNAQAGLNDIGLRIGKHVHKRLHDNAAAALTDLP